MEAGLQWDGIAELDGCANGENAIRAVGRGHQTLPALDVERMRDESVARVSDE